MFQELQHVAFIRLCITYLAIITWYSGKSRFTLSFIKKTVYSQRWNFVLVFWYLINKLIRFVADSFFHATPSTDNWLVFDSRDPQFFLKKVQKKDYWFFQPHLKNTFWVKNTAVSITKKNVFYPLHTSQKTDKRLWRVATEVGYFLLQIWTNCQFQIVLVVFEVQFVSVTVHENLGLVCISPEVKT